MVLKDLIAELLPGHWWPGTGATVEFSRHAMAVEIQPGGRVHLITQMQPVVTMDFPLTNVQLGLHVFCHHLGSLKGSMSASSRAT